MYCRKCGKQIDYDAEFCKECQGQGGYFLSFQPEPPVLKGSKKDGLVKGILSIIFGVIAFLFVVLFYLLAWKMRENTSADADFEEAVATGFLIFFLAILCGVPALAHAIPAFVLGILSLKCFFRAKREGRIKPVNTLTLGSIGLAFSLVAILPALYFAVSILFQIIRGIIVEMLL